MAKNVVSFNGSPHGMSGMTAMILQPFLDGLMEGGCDIMNFNVIEHDIKPCMGDLSCWLRTDGNCAQDDDMIEILNVSRDADIFVVATPVYVDGMSGTLKNMIDRMVPLVLPFIEYDEQHMWHPWRSGKRHAQVALVSTCGFWSVSNFDPLVAHVQAISRNFKAEYAGALLRPHASAIYEMQRIGVGIDDILLAAKNAGKELAETGKMSQSNLDTVSRTLIERNEYVDRLNEFFDNYIKEKGKTN